MIRAVLFLALVGCAASHERGRDGGIAGTDATASDVTLALLDGGTDAPTVVCGPNVCRPGEICCNAECGVCAFADECIDFGCPGGP